MSAVTTPAISLYLGDDAVIQHTVYQADGTTAQDITGWSLSAELQDVDRPQTVYWAKTVGSGITLVDPANGRDNITVARADTVAMKAGRYQLSIARTDAGAYAELTLIPVDLLQR